MITKTSLKHPTVRRRIREAMREAVAIANISNAHYGNLAGCAHIPGIGFVYYLPRHKGTKDVSRHGFVIESLATKGPVRNLNHLLFTEAA